MDETRMPPGAGSRLPTAAVGLLAALFLPIGLAAQEGPERPPPEMGVGGWEIGAFGGLTDTQALTGDTLGPLPIGNAASFGGRLGYSLPSGVFVEGDVSYVPNADFLSLRPLTADELSILRFGAAAGYNVQVAPRLQVFPRVGAGAVRWDPEGLDAETDFEARFGGGARYFVTPTLALRADAGALYAPDPMDDIVGELGGDVGIDDPGGLWGYEITAGISVFLGGPADSDGDGVRDGRDACPDTPEDARVDAEGCPVDSDGDGVPDHRDACPGTPRGARVDADGCPTDEDGDGVYDGLDECPDTPADAQVDDDGCPTDEDGDGVYDGLDECPDTPAGAEVDDDGCPTDDDGDGVYDGLDQCPNTAPGTEVDEHGCPRNVYQEELEEEGRVVLNDVHFAFDRAEIQPQFTDDLDKVGQALLANPDMRIEIQGHTDSIASEAYNRRLGERRAQAVLNYLMENFPELDRRSFTVRSYGETRPQADNGTSKGRAQNRRVEFVVLEDGDHVTGEEEKGGGGGS